VAPWRGVNGTAQSRIDPRAYATPDAPLGAYPGMEREAGATRSDGRNESASWFCFFLILFTTFFRSCSYFAPRFNTRLVLKHLFLRWMSDQQQRFFSRFMLLILLEVPSGFGLDLMQVICSNFVVERLQPAMVSLLSYCADGQVNVMVTRRQLDGMAGADSGRVGG
jgi:hypothetical protein